MQRDTTHFQYCQKIVVFDEDFKNVLLAKRKGEQDFDGVFSFIGGKMETTDGSFKQGLIREVDEEVGGKVKLRVYLGATVNELFTKKDGNAMVLPHYLAVYKGGDIELNDEYSEYKWVSLDKISDFGPTIETVPSMVARLKSLAKNLKESDFTEI